MKTNAYTAAINLFTTKICNLLCQMLFPIMAMLMMLKLWNNARNNCVLLDAETNITPQGTRKTSHDIAFKFITA